MHEATAAERTREIEAERQVLHKARIDIENGRKRLRHQEDLVSSLRASGQKAIEAERLLDLFKRILMQWERHRVLIEQRIAYLEATDAAENRGAEHRE